MVKAELGQNSVNGHGNGGGYRVRQAQTVRRICYIDRQHHQ